MRTIRFRGKRIGLNEWVEGSLVTNEKELFIRLTTYDFQHGYLMCIVEPETVGQFIEERNGIEFFEGDKVNHPIIGDGVIVWASTGYVIKYENQCIDLHEDWDELTVIGNIHDTTSNEVNK